MARPAGAGPGFGLELLVASLGQWLLFFGCAPSAEAVRFAPAGVAEAAWQASPFSHSIGIAEGFRAMGVPPVLPHGTNGGTDHASGAGRRSWQIPLTHHHPVGFPLHASHGYFGEAMPTTVGADGPPIKVHTGRGPIVVKFLHMNSESDVQAAVNELQTLLKLQRSKGFLSLYQYPEHTEDLAPGSERVMLILEEYSGNLRQYLDANEGRLSIQALFRLLIPILEGLTDIRRARRAHRPPTLDEVLVIGSLTESIYPRAVLCSSIANTDACICGSRRARAWKVLTGTEPPRKPGQKEISYMREMEKRDLESVAKIVDRLIAALRPEERDKYPSTIAELETLSRQLAQVRGAVTHSDAVPNGDDALQHEARGAAPDGDIVLDGDSDGDAAAEHKDWRFRLMTARIALWRTRQMQWRMRRTMRKRKEALQTLSDSLRENPVLSILVDNSVNKEEPKDMEALRMVTQVLREEWKTRKEIGFSDVNALSALADPKVIGTIGITAAAAAAGAGDMSWLVDSGALETGIADLI